MWFNCKQFSGNKLTFVTNIDAFKIAKYALSKSQIQVKRSHWIKPRFKLTVKMNQTFFFVFFYRYRLLQFEIANMLLNYKIVLSLCTLY